MAYQLEPNESIPAGIPRIIQEQSDQAVASLQNVAADPDPAIHDARKCFKKIRAALRLVRDEVGQDVYRQENVCYRDAGRRLSAVRDSFVKGKTLDALVAHYAQQLDEDAFRETRQQLADAHNVLRRRLLDEDVPGRVVATLVAARPRIATLPIERDGYDAIRDGLHRVYERGYRGLVRAYAAPTPDAFHEWRKRVKYLWYHVRILTPLWPGFFDEWAAQLDVLGGYLGDAHDAAVLQARIAAEPSLCPDEDERALLLALTERRHAELEATAYPLGRRIYAETPAAFVVRVAAYWQAWQVKKTGM